MTGRRGGPAGAGRSWVAILDGMVSALSGFALIGVIVLVGWAARRWAGLPENAEAVLGRVVFSVLSPCLLFTGVAAADPGVLLSEPLIVSTAAALICFGLEM